MADLFQRDKSVISRHIKNIFDEGELVRSSVVANSATTAADGKTYQVEFYNLDVIITATPKTKTMELFGSRPNSSQPAGPGNLPAPFHVYSMRQAIEEGFILDVLKNYTPYRLAFRLAHDGKDYDDKTVERSAALKSIMG